MTEQSFFQEDALIHARKEKLISFARRNVSAIGYVFLALVVFIAVRIRTANLPGLRDITTGDWTLGPDLDPFLFLRWAKYIVENGSLMVLDTLRYVPLGFDTSYELNLHVYLIVWFDKIAGLFSSTSITHSAVIYPVFMFALSVGAFFLMTRKIFLKSFGVPKSNVLALIASFFLAVTPALLPRTIAGIPEKEASGLLFLFLAFYFFISAWEKRTTLYRYILAIFAGVATAVMGLVWGGYLYISLTIGSAALVAFILGKFDKERKIAYTLWAITFLALILVFTERYSLTDILTSITSAPFVFALALIIIDSLLFNTQARKYIEKYATLSKIPRPIFSLLVTVVVSTVLVSITLGPRFILDKILTLKRFLITPAVDRLNVTVAENRQPYFLEWAANFGPYIKKIPLFLWAFFIGSVMVFYQAIISFDKKARTFMTAAFALSLISLIFSRYSPTSLFNGINVPSLLLYTFGPLVFLVAGFIYYRNYVRAGEQERLKNTNFNFVFLLCFFVISLLSARGGIRLVMMLVPAASILAAYGAVETAHSAFNAPKATTKKYVLFAVTGVFVLSLMFAGFTFYNVSMASAKGYIPSIYTQQWQKAMAWVRENTQENAVFGHWWDYGYWVQSIGERATVLDGGNAKAYWNHMMGRYALTGPSNEQALDFLYAHRTTHFLIDPTDIGKYGAFSSIGSDKNYDRTSFIQTFDKDPNQILEKKNSTVFVYAGGIPTDDDILYTLNGTQLFLPKGNAALGAILLEKDSITGELTRAPDAVFIYKGNQYLIPLRYAFDEKLIDFKDGLDAGIFIMPRLVSGANGFQIQDDGSLLYLSNRTVHSQFARLYLFQEENGFFEQVHSEDDPLVTQLRLTVPDFKGDFVVYDSVRGPIRIWEIHYPSTMKVNSEYLSEEWPAEIFKV